MKKRSVLAILIVLMLAALCAAGFYFGQRSGGVHASDHASQTAETEDAGIPSDAVVVKSASELLAAIAPDTYIYIDAPVIELDSAPDYGFDYYGGAYTWLHTADNDYTLVIRGVSGLTIRGREGGTLINTCASSSDVLRLENCDEPRLIDLKLGHRSAQEGNFCLGSVLALDNCRGLLMSDCDLFGCGSIAVNAVYSDAVHIEDSVLHDCSLSAVYAVYCADIQLRGCEISRCGAGSYLGVLCGANCSGLALINCDIKDCSAAFLLDVMNTDAACLLGCEATGCSFSEALMWITDYDVTVSGCALWDNEFGSCYSGDGSVARSGSGTALMTFADFNRMEKKAYTGTYYGPSTPAGGMPYTTASDITTPSDIATPSDVNFIEDITGMEFEEIHVSTVDELLSAIGPLRTVYLDGDNFDLSTASDYGTGSGEYYSWQEVYDGYELVISNLQGLNLVGGGMDKTLVSAQPRYADVISFNNCRDISLVDMTLGHSEASGSCTGDVVSIFNCKSVDITRCGLYGCGMIGVFASESSRICVSHSSIYDCSYLGVQLQYVDEAIFIECSITGCGSDEFGFNGLRLDECSEIIYNGQELDNGETVV